MKIGPSSTLLELSRFIHQYRISITSVLRAGGGVQIESSYQGKAVGIETDSLYSGIKYIIHALNAQHPGLGLEWVPDPERQARIVERAPTDPAPPPSWASGLPEKSEIVKELLGEGVALDLAKAVIRKDPPRAHRIAERAPTEPSPAPTWVVEDLKSKLDPEAQAQLQATKAAVERAVFESFSNALDLRPALRPPRARRIPVEGIELEYAGCHLPLSALEPDEVCPACDCLARSHRNHPSNRQKT